MNEHCVLAHSVMYAHDTATHCNTLDEHHAMRHTAT